MEFNAKSELSPTNQSPAAILKYFNSNPVNLSHRFWSIPLKISQKSSALILNPIAFKLMNNSSRSLSNAPFSINRLTIPNLPFTERPSRMASTLAAWSSRMTRSAPVSIDRAMASASPFPKPRHGRRAPMSYIHHSKPVTTTLMRPHSFTWS